MRVEPLPAQDPAVRHLWERVTTLNDFHDPHLALDTTIATLVAAGALHADDPVIGDAQTTLALVRPDDSRPAQKPGDLPEPWRSLLARWGQTGRPVGKVAVGAVTPPFDGVTAAVIDLESRDEHSSLTVELVPGARTGLPYRDLPEQQHLTWWAADNLGNHYLAEQGSWSWSDDRAGGAMGFWPALDPQASSIDLMPTATATRAIIRAPLHPALSNSAQWLDRPATRLHDRDQASVKGCGVPTVIASRQDCAMFAGGPFLGCAGGPLP